MKKILLILLIISSINLFGYYSSENMIDMLVHSNQLRIRTDRLGALFGNRNIRAVIGVTGANNASGIILHNILDPTKLDNQKSSSELIPAVLGAIGYDSDLFGIAVGYEFLYKSSFYMVHTPILHITALNDNFRINIPISIGVGQKSSYSYGQTEDPSLKGSMVISTGIEARYYFNHPIFSHVRLFFNYGNATIKEINNYKINFTQQSIGFQARAYFRHEFSYGMILEPIIRVQFDAALPTRYNNLEKSVNIVDNYFITAKGFSPSDGIKTAGQEGSTGANADLEKGSLKGGYVASIPGGYYAEAPYRVGVAIPLGFRATSEDKNIEFYLEPALSLTIVNAKNIYDFTGAQSDMQHIEDYRRKDPFYTLGYVVYGELYIRPIPQLEWYSEIQTGGASVLPSNLSSGSSTTLVFNASTGITWYF